jgi:hypothetical protein
MGMATACMHMYVLVFRVWNPVIFRYFFNGTSGFAVCGNNLYAQVCTRV